MDEEKPKTDELKSETVNETWFFINNMKTDEKDYSFEEEFPIICDEVFGAGFYRYNASSLTLMILEHQIIKMVEELCAAKHSAEQKGIPYLCKFEDVEGLPEEQLKNIQIINGDYQFESQLLRYFLTILNEFDHLPYNQNLHSIDKEDEFFSVKLASDNKSKTIFRINEADRLFCLLPEVHDDNSSLYLIYEDRPRLNAEGSSPDYPLLRRFNSRIYPNNKYYEIADYLTKESQIFITHVYVNSKPSLYEKYDYMVGLSVDMLCKLNKKLTFKAKLDKPISIDFEDVYLIKSEAKQLGILQEAESIEVLPEVGIKKNALSKDNNARAKLLQVLNDFEAGKIKNKTKPHQLTSSRQLYIDAIREVQDIATLNSTTFYQIKEHLENKDVPKNQISLDTFKEFIGIINKNLS